MAKQGTVDGFLDPVMNTLFGNTDEEDAARLAEMQAIQELYANREAPELKNMDYDDFEYLGDYSPEASVVAPTISAGDDIDYEGFDPRLAEIETAKDSAFNDIRVDPELKRRQLDALMKFDEIIEGGGMTASDEANLNRIQGDVAQADRGRREAIQQNMASRGMGGGGMELLAMLDSSQAATDRANQSGLDIAGMAEDRALQAIMQGGNMAGNMRGQEFGEQSQVAQANDIIDKFNTQLINQGNQWNTGQQNQYGYNDALNSWQNDWRNRETNLGVDQWNANNAFDVSKINTAYANDAGMANWNAKQGINNMNTALGNDEQTFNNYTLPNTRFANEGQIIAGKAGGHDMMANYWGDQAAAEDAKDAGQLQGLARMGAAVYTGGASEVAFNAADQQKKNQGGQ